MTEWIHRGTQTGVPVHGTGHQVPAVSGKHTHAGSSAAKSVKEPFPPPLKYIFVNLRIWSLYVLFLLIKNYNLLPTYIVNPDGLAQNLVLVPGGPCMMRTRNSNTAWPRFHLHD
jgi:hypothetical protein